jgi:predicted small secreted protein
MRILKALVLVLALAAAAGPLTACSTLQDAWENVRDTVD